MKIATLRAATGMTFAQANTWHPLLLPAMERFEINTPLRQAHFLSQMGHESLGFTKLLESFMYTDPVRIARIFKSPFDLNNNGKVDAAEVEFAKGYVRNPVALANRAYANRMGNGDEASGDGYKYRGRGLTHLTGKDNYLKAGQALSLPLVEKPELASSPENAAVIAAWYWQRNGLNILADADRATDITKRINGGTNGLEDRLARLQVAKKALLP